MSAKTAVLTAVSSLLSPLTASPAQVVGVLAIWEIMKPSSGSKS